MNALADTGSYYAGAGDGSIEHTSSQVWDTTHNAALGTAAYQNISNVYVGCVGNWPGVLNYTISRGFFPIDTSGIADDATITSALLKVYVVAKTNTQNDGNDWLNVVQTSQNSPTTLALADYDNCGAVHSAIEGATRIDLGDIATAAYNSWILNATGIGWISKTGTTLLGLREGHDILDIQVGTAAQANRIQAIMSEDTSETKDPYLEVTYTVPAAPAKFRFDGGQMKIKGKVKFE
ncbi:hypothetical protein KJ586_00325 [Patescibacteria group bacterium]|nr:hypothetical protein [Patescibacteria group bacterium]